MNHLPKTDSIFFVCTEGLVTSVAGAEALKAELVKHNLYDIKIQHIQLEWIPEDAEIILCHETLENRVLEKAPHATVIAVTDFLHAPEYAELAEKLEQLAE